MIPAPPRIPSMEREGPEPPLTCPRGPRHGAGGAGAAAEGSWELRAGMSESGELGKGPRPPGRQVGSWSCCEMRL